jgi:hypothetical protein
MRVTGITLIRHTGLLMTAKTSVASLIVWCLFSSPATLWAQAAAPQDPPSQAASPSAGQQVEVENDIYKGLREVADSFKAEYVRARETKLALVRRWLATRKCQAARINPVIAEVVSALEQWRSREVDYWQKWNEEEAIKAQRTARQIEDYKVRQAEAKSLKEDYDDELATMQKKFDDLEKGPKNPETRKKADILTTSMQEKRAAIDAVVKKYEELVQTINELDGSYTVVLVQIRENLRQVETWIGNEKVFWAQKTTEAEQICGTNKPNTNSAEPAKGGRGQH